MEIDGVTARILTAVPKKTMLTSDRLDAIVNPSATAVAPDGLAKAVSGPISMNVDNQS